MSEDRLQTREAMLFELQAEKHNHRVDNEYLVGQVNELHSENDRLRKAIKLAHYALTKSSLTADERVYDATGVLSRQLALIAAE